MQKNSFRSNVTFWKPKGLAFQVQTSQGIKTAGNRISDAISASQDLFRFFWQDPKRECFFFTFAMRLRLYFNSFHVIHHILYRGPHPLTLFHIYRMFHSLPDVLKIYQIQFDRSLVNIAFSADSLPFEPINFHFNSRVSREIIFICYSIVLTKRSTFWPQLTTFEERLKWT